MIRLEGLGMRESEEGKRCSRAAPNPTSWIQKGKGGGEGGGKGGQKGGEREVFYKKIGFCKFLLGLYKRILEKKVYICNIRIRNR